MAWDLEKSRRPELVFADVIKQAVEGKDGRLFLRARVLAYDTVGGQLQNPSGAGQLTVTSQDGSSASYPATVGPKNPVGSVKARVLTSGRDSFIEDVDARVYWPMLSHEALSFPLLPGEHVLVVAEDANSDHGLWISRAPGGEDVNYSRGESSYTAPLGQRTAADAFVEPELGYSPDDTAEAPPRDLSKLFEGG